MLKFKHLSRREKEIMDGVYRLGRATAAQIRINLAAAPSYSSVRSTLGVLERKGQLTHEYDGNRYVYAPTVQREKARQSALDHLLTTFFGGSTAELVAALLEHRRADLSPGELDELSSLIEQTRKEGGG